MTFLDFLHQMVGNSTIEYVAVLFGFLNVFLIIRRSIWNYLFGFIMCVLYARIFYDYQLYSDSLLQVFFFITQFYGLWYWLKHKAPDNKVIVAPLSSRTFSFCLIATVFLWLTLGWFMSSFTDASYPYWDSSIAALSVTAQILLMRRHLQSWYLWILVDILAIGLFVVKGLAPTSVLYAVFLVLACIGAVQWTRAAKT